MKETNIKQQWEEKEKNLLSDVVEYLSDNGIIFSGNEAGNMWNNI